jgi:ADP-dependent NAD(P)H-hydrate dehydratase / NAD(P)H-hydrate epimerase
LINKSSIADEWAARFSSLLEDQPRKTGRPRRAAGLATGSIELLTPEEMSTADRQTISAGTPGISLMERAGHAVAEAVSRLAAAGARVAVLAGPGNNGGDGFVAATALAEDGYSVKVGLLGSRNKLRGDAAIAAKNWSGAVDDLTPAILKDADVIVDALFGAGLDRPIEGTAASVIAAVNESNTPVVAVDLPSGINGRDGNVLGFAIRALETVTFFRRKPGHVLLPGRTHAGRVSVVDIGIDANVLQAIRPNALLNTPDLWRGQFPMPGTDGHKYDRGHTIVVSGPMTHTGAARLAARGALRIGSGLVTVAAPREALAVHASHLTAIMLLQMDGAVDLSEILQDERRNSVVMGPALGIGDPTKALVKAALERDPAVVLDADALISFAEKPAELFEVLGQRTAPTVLTPHAGEFARLFPDLARNPSKLERARAASSQAGAIVVLKGPDTVVAAPDGLVAIADNAPPDLATAGSGDVLAGIIGGLLAQGMSDFDAAAAGVWMHGAAATAAGRGLIAEDLPEALPDALGQINKSHTR